MPTTPIHLEWLNRHEIPVFEPGEPVYLFGAGAGSLEFLTLVETGELACRVLALVDNDPSLHGTTLKDIPVISPTELHTRVKPGQARILVTTASGREAVAAQLAELGYLPDRDVVPCGRYPSAALDNLKDLLLAEARHGFLAQARRVLHVGPGGFLGLECALHALGAREVHSLEAVSFGLSYPSLGNRLADYRIFRRRFLALTDSLGYPRAPLAQGFDACFLKGETPCPPSFGGEPDRLDQTRVACRYPHRFSALPYADESLDLLCSFAVLEHVQDPEAAVAESFRVLAPGGTCLARILTQDHRSFERPGFSPIEYLTVSEAEWAAITAERFHQNRVLPDGWRELFLGAGFRLAEFRVLDRYDVRAEERARLHPDFASLAPEILSQLNVFLVAHKPAG